MSKTSDQYNQVHLCVCGGVIAVFVILFFISVEFLKVFSALNLQTKALA